MRHCEWGTAPLTTTSPHFQRRPPREGTRYDSRPSGRTGGEDRPDRPPFRRRGNTFDDPDEGRRSRLTARAVALEQLRRIEEEGAFSGLVSGPMSPARPDDSLTGAQCRPVHPPPYPTPRQDPFGCADVDSEDMTRGVVLVARDGSKRPGAGTLSDLEDDRDRR